MFTGIDHLAIVVEDIEPAMERYEESFGAERMGMNSDEHREAHGVVAAFYRVGGSVIELMAPLSEEGWAYDRLQEHGEGFFHIAFAVEDIHEAMAELETRGIGLRSDEPGQGFSGKIVTLDPDDTIVPMQIVEPE